MIAYIVHVSGEVVKHQRQAKKNVFIERQQAPGFLLWEEGGVGHGEIG